VADLSLSIGGLVGVVLSGGFVYAEIGRFATPQVPETLFDERREVFAYTVGLFVGVPLAIALLFFFDSMANGALPGAILFLVALVVGTEVAQWALLRTHYWGQGESGPFYALGYRSGIAGIFALTVVAQYLAGSNVTWLGIVLVLLESIAILALEVSGALLSYPRTEATGQRNGGPLAGALFGAFGFFILGLGALSGVGTSSGQEVALAAAFVALFGGILVYRRLRPILETIPAPTAGTAPPPRAVPPTYGRVGPDSDPGRRE
jgi:hypothetical protein